MVKSFGMSEKVGFRSIKENTELFVNSPTYAPSTNEAIDNEIKRLLQVNLAVVRFIDGLLIVINCLAYLGWVFFLFPQESYERAKTILKLHAKEHKQLAEALLQYETLDAGDVAAIANGKRFIFKY